MISLVKNKRICPRFREPVYIVCRPTTYKNIAGAYHNEGLRLGRCIIVPVDITSSKVIAEVAFGKEVPCPRKYAICSVYMASCVDELGCDNVFVELDLFVSPRWCISINGAAVE